MRCVCKKINSKFILFCIAVSLYSFLFLVGPITVSKEVQYVLQIILSSGAFLFLLNNIVRKKKILLDNDAKILVNLFVAWGVVTALRGFFSDLSFRGLVLCFSNPRIILAYLMPFLVCMSVTPQKMDNLRNVWIFSFFIAVILVFNFKNVLMVSSLNEFGAIYNVENHFYSYLNVAQLLPEIFGCCAFFFIKGNFPKWTTKVIIFFSVLLTFISPLLLGRRSSAFSVLLFVSLWGVLKLKKKKKWLLIFVALLLILYSLFMYYENIIVKLFPILFDRIGNDTRSWAMAEFYQAFNGDYLSYLLGRGSLGVYYSKTFGFRSIIETGWMDMILHGGILLLASYVCILGLSFFRGFFYSDKPIVNAMALFLLAQLILLYPAGHMSFDLRSVSIWICVSCCLSKDIRKNGIQYGERDA